MNELSIIIPVLAGFEKLPVFIDDLVRFLKANPGDADIILVVDQTVKNPESSMAYVREHYPWLQFRVLQKYGPGSVRNYGALVRFGMAYSNSKYVVLVSPYGENDLSKIREMLDVIRKGHQLVQATRYMNPQDAKQIKFPFRLYQTIYRFSIRILLGLNVSDSTYGFKMFDRVFVESLGVTRNRFSICPEITIKSLLAGGQVAYVSTAMQPAAGSASFQLYREGLGYFLVILRGFLHRLGLLWF